MREINMDKRHEIYEKALELFISEGYEQTPLSKIAKAMGITKAGLYHYFKSKEELLFFIHEQNLRRDLLPIVEAAGKISDPKDRISYLIDSYTESSMSRDPSQRMLIHELGNLTPEHRKIILIAWRKFFDIFRDTIFELEITGRSKKINKTFAAFALIGMCRWTFNWYDPRRKDSAKEVCDTYKEIFFNGILKD
jgi:TetR/AcrR family transcriptional regulator, cholesterol catabolism regulator